MSRSKGISLTFFSNGFRVSGLMLKSLVLSELIFCIGERYGSSFILLPMDVHNTVFLIFNKYTLCQF